MSPFGAINDFLARFWAALTLAVTGFFLRRARYRSIEIKLAGSFPERWIPSSPLEYLRRPRMTHYDLLTLLDRVAVDDKIDTVLLSVGPTSLGFARLQEVARALLRVKAAGKKLVALIETASTREMLLAAICERRVLAPSGMIALTGLSMEMMFFRGLLDKGDVKPDLLVAGKFKNAGETYTRKTASQAAREMTDGLLDNLYEQVVVDLAEALGKTKAQAQKLIDGGPYTPPRAKKAGLIDTIAYRDELLKELQLDKAPHVPLIGRAYLRTMQRRDRAAARLRRAPQIAVMHVRGTIREGQGDMSGGNPGAKGYVKILRRLRRDKDFAAVVLRVSSPGGAAMGSDLIRREVARVAEKKPVIVSLGDVAASGGYMIAVGGRKILCERGTLTGSIGVIAGKFDLSGLFAKMGISIDRHRRGAAASIWSSTSRFTKVERQRMEEILAHIYGEFKEAVAAGRKLPLKRIDELAEGRVWTGNEAVRAGLADELGGLGDAVRLAVEAAGGAKGEPPRLVEFPQVPGPLKTLLSLGAAAQASPLSLLDHAVFERARLLAAGPFAGLPFELEIR